jgi:hypothetical protein
MVGLGSGESVAAGADEGATLARDGEAAVAAVADAAGAVGAAQHITRAMHATPATAARPVHSIRPVRTNWSGRPTLALRIVVSSHRRRGRRHDRERGPFRRSSNRPQRRNKGIATTLLITVIVWFLVVLHGPALVYPEAGGSQS